MIGTIGVKEILTKIKDNKTLMNGALFSLFSFINRGFGFVLLLILANYMPPAEYGYLGLFNTVTMLMGYFVCLQVDGYLGVSYFNDDKKGIKNTISCIYFTTLLMTLLFSLILIAGGCCLSDALSLPLDMVTLAIPICFLTVFVNINLDWFRLKEKVLTYGCLSCSNALLNFTLSIVFVKYLSMGWEGRVWAQAACFLTFGLSGFIYFIQQKQVGLPTWSHWKRILVWGIPLIPHMATNYIKQGCDRYIINSHHSIDDVGLFTFALNIANIIIMIGMGFNQSDSVEVYKVLGNKEKSNEEKKIKLAKRRHVFAKLYAFSTLLIVGLGYFIIPLLLPKYELAMNYFLFLSIFGFINCLYFLYTNYLFFYGRTKLIMSITFGTSLLHLALSLLLTRYSLYYTCFIYCVSMGAMVFFIRIFALKELNNQM